MVTVFALTPKSIPTRIKVTTKKTIILAKTTVNSIFKLYFNSHKTHKSQGHKSRNNKSNTQAS